MAWRRENKLAGKGVLFSKAVARRRMALLEGLESRLLFSAPPLPVITGPTFNISTYGAIGDGVTNNTVAIQNAINAASAAAIAETNSHSSLTGAVVQISSAASPYECGPITIPSNVDLQIDAGAELQALAFGTYPNSMTSPSHFITVKNATNVELTGSGTIDGQGAPWWAAYNAGTISNRPRLINITGSNVLLIQGLKLTNSPMFHIAFGSTNNVTINGVTVATPSTSPNTDGFDPSGSHYLIENCNISTGDDNIAIKPQGTFCSDMTVTFCTFGTGHGLSVGGETNDGLNGLEVDNCTFNGTTSGIRLKAGRTTGGLVQNCTYTNLTMTNVQYPININSYYPNTIPPNADYTDPAQAVTAGTPIWQNITFSNITATDSASNSACGVIWGLPEEPVKTVTMTNVRISAHFGMIMDHVRNVTFDSSCHFTSASGADEVGDTASGFPVPVDAIVTQAGWIDQDIGSPAVLGTSLFDPSLPGWTVDGSGTGIGGTLDKFNLASTSLVGDGGIVAQVKTQTNTDAGAQAGVMIRESNAANAAFAAVVLTPSDGAVFEWRASDGAAVQSITLGGITDPRYVRVLRQGNSFTGYYGSNGTTWTQIGTAESVTMTNNALEGLAVTANASSGVSTATFSNVDTGPSIANAAAATLNPVTGTLTHLSSLGSSAAGLGLTYTWSVSGPAAVGYTINGTSGANNTTATFSEAGSYNFTVTVTDADGLSVTSSVGVNVNQTAVAVGVSPDSTTVATNSSQQFSATATDQFGDAIASPVFTWSITGADNSIDSSGLATLGPTADTYTVTAAIGGVQGTADVTTVAAPVLSSFTINDGSAQRATITSLTVVFSEPVTVVPGAITLNLRDPLGGASTPQTFVLSNPSSDQQTYVLTFTGAGYTGGSLNDGVYDLMVSAAGVSNSVGGTLASGDQTFSFYRLYGDYFGTGTVDFSDLVLLAQDFDATAGQGNFLPFMDIDGDGTIGFAELVKLAQNFDSSLSVTSASGPLHVQPLVRAVGNPYSYSPPSPAAADTAADPLASSVIKLQS